MQKRSSRFEMVFSLTFILVFILISAAFLSGVRVGANKVETKYENLAIVPSSSEFADSYQQQDLVTFYHTVFLPYREFKSEWVSLTDEISRTDDSNQVNKVLKQLRTLADEQYSAITKTTMYSSSPLLQEAQTDFLKSVRLFGNSADNYKMSSSLYNGEKLMNNLKQDQLYKNGVSYGLLAQKKYYISMIKWNINVDPSLKKEYDFTKDFSFDEWEGFPLIVKNAAVSTSLLTKSIYDAYDPQDMTARIDDMIQSGNADTMNLTSIGAIIKLLDRTDAVKENDFTKWNNKYYSQELLPQLPFFYDN
ncbi:hypothetical protein [Paenibacillus crassostreae]|uniref:Uncharacterized protein n=1 Tax=Paenibacillus crassostreae TaxID=1763538 RepID=A0A167DJB5_9BACL|nr:hypothetical protein [Paenibacillus crassostreae]AOZ91398.1 hypothetical protein LPB68_03710 [Paenibacillus crassostreae]OAB74442.1 hypothetical protein PNBC_10250 [Paenibacillus crassostreae]